MIVHDNVRQVLPVERESHGLRCSTPWWRVGSLSSAAMFKAPYLTSMKVATHETEISSHVNSQFRRDAIVPPQGLFRYAPLLRVLQHTTPHVEIQESSVRVPSTPFPSYRSRTYPRHVHVCARGVAACVLRARTCGSVCPATTELHSNAREACSILTMRHAPPCTAWRVVSRARARLWPRTPRPSRRPRVRQPRRALCGTMRDSANRPF